MSRWPLSSPAGWFPIVIFLTLLTACAGPRSAAAPSCCEESGSLPRTVSLAGQWKIRPDGLSPANAYLPSTDDRSWHSAEVPANWYLSHGDHSGAVWYRTRFTAPPSWKNRLVRLVFGGVDYAADVWLNGYYLGFHEGYFAPFSFVVTDHLRPGADNLLAVRVNSPFEEPGRSWSLRKRLIKGIFNHHDTRPGGAWSLRGQEKNTGGIWGPVLLRISDQASLDRMAVTPLVDLKTGTARAAVAAEITWDGGRTTDVLCRLSLWPHNFNPSPHEAVPVCLTERRALVRGANRLEFTLPALPVRLWNSWDHGRPNLYRAELTLSRNGELLDRKKEIFGFRKVGCDPATMIWTLNGRRIFLRGTNYISDQWLSQMTREKYACDLALMKRAHINAVRVHAHVEAGEFYRLCDETGMLVWQDFPLQWGYTDAPAFVKTARRQAGEMAETLYNHPSVIAWCGHNEPPWEADWMQYKYPDYDPAQNKVLDAEIYACLAEKDPSRYVHKASVSEEHPWLGWYSGKWQDYNRPASHPLITEFGAQALPGIESLKKIFSPDALWPDSDADWEKWAYHNFQRRETFEIAGVKMGKDIREFIRNTQAYQARLIRCAAESYRRQRFSPVTGIFQFMFAENWPSVNWGIVDYWRNPKPGYRALQKAYQPVLPSIECSKAVWTAGETVSARIWLINDRHTALNGANLHYLLTGKNSPADRGSLPVSVGPDSAEPVLSLRWAGLPEGEFELTVTIEDNRKKIISRNDYRFRVREKYP